MKNNNTMDSHQYEVGISWSGDRKGIMCSPEVTGSADGSACIEIATPPQFPKGIPGIWSPEHLFTAAVSSCLMTTFLAIADNSKLNFSGFRCRAFGKLAEVESRMVMSEVLLEPVVTIPDEKDKERTLRILEKAEKACLISNSIKSTILMDPKVIVDQKIDIEV